MERITTAEFRSASCGEKTGENGVEYVQLGEEIQRLMVATAPETGSSFSALLELPANQAMELLHSPETDKTPAERPSEVWTNQHRIDHHIPSGLHSLNCSPTIPSNTALLKRFSRLSVFPAAENSPETSSIPANSNENSHKLKQEPLDSDLKTNLSDLMIHNKNQSRKRRKREKKAKESTKKSKSVANETSDYGEKLPYIHVRARRGQATDSHSLAERARREKINARMKLLQELVPGCNKISGTAMVLDEIINHVQSLQRQVESGSPMDGTFPGTLMPLMQPEGLVNGNKQQYQQLLPFDGLHQPVWRREDNHHVITPENSLLSSFNKFSISALKSALNQLKMEL